VNGKASFDELYILPGQEEILGNMALHFGVGSGAWTACYDENGNMACRQEDGLAYCKLEMPRTGWLWWRTWPVTS
jgi:hypothetical protein